MTGAGMLEEALALAADRWPIFPLAGKLPKIPKDAGGNGFKDATTDPDTIREWWTRWPDANIGLAIPDDLIVIDIDPRHGGDESWTRLLDGRPEPETLAVRTGGPDGGRHLYFWHPGGKLKAFPRDWGIDLREGGRHYVVCPPSVHPETGAAYVWETTATDPAECPRWLTDALREPARASRPQAGPFTVIPDPFTTSPSDAAAAGLIRHVAALREGNRNNGLHWAACRAAEKGMLDQLAPDLAAAARGIGLPDGEIARVLQSVRENGPTAAPQYAQEWPARQPAPTAPRTWDEAIRGQPRAADEDRTEDEGHSPASWRPVDLTAILDGTFTPVKPTLLARVDGVCLVYPGCTHSMHGESESGKSLVMQFEASRNVTAGRAVLYIDFESDAAQVVARLRMFGASVEAIRDHFTYVNPEQSPFSAESERDAWRAMLAQGYALAIIDGVTDSVGMFGFSSKDNDELSTWQRVFPDTIARRTGAAVVSIDHVTKDGEGRGRFAIGAQAKMAGLTGAAYTVEVLEPLGLGLRGVVVLRVAKDRPGQVRPHCGNWRKTDRTQEAARLIFDATGPAEVVTVESWTDAATAAGKASGTFRPTTLMERVSRALEDAGEVSMNTIKATVAGKAQAIATALDVLTEEGYVARRDGPNRSKLHRSERPYRQTQDPASDSYVGPGTTQAPEGVESE